jgi:hypothetical protein
MSFKNIVMYINSNYLIMSNIHFKCSGLYKYIF